MHSLGLKGIRQGIRATFGYTEIQTHAGQLDGKFAAFNCSHFFTVNEYWGSKVPIFQNINRFKEKDKCYFNFAMKETLTSERFNNCKIRDFNERKRDFNTWKEIGVNKISKNLKKKLRV